MERTDGTLVTMVAMPTHASQGPLVNEHSDEIQKVRTEVVQAGLDRAYGTVRHVVQGSRYHLLQFTADSVTDTLAAPMMHQVILWALGILAVHFQFYRPSTTVISQHQRF